MQTRLENSPFPGHRITRRHLVVLGAAALAPLLPGCTTGHQGEQHASAANTLRYPLSSPPTTLDPALVQDGTTIDLLQNIFEGLVVLDTSSKVVPGIAEKWDVSSDGKTYTFHLRQNVKFHNGRTVTASDFKYSLERACSATLNSQTVFSYLNDIVGAMDCRNGKASNITGVRVQDPSTLVIEIDQPKSYWLDKMTYPTGYVVCQEAIQENGGKVEAGSAIGAGPFKIAAPGDYQANYEVTLTAFKDYHGGSPKLDHIVRPVLPDPSTRLAKYQANTLDIVKISPTDVDHVDADPTLKPDLHLYPRAATWYLAMNSAAPNSPFGDIRVRKAFAMAIDNTAITRIALKNLMDPANSVVPPGMGDYHSTCVPLPFSPSMAKTMLASAGYGAAKPFPVLALTFRNDYQWVADSAQVLAHQLQQNLGVTVQLQPMEWSQFLDNLDRLTMPLALERWEADYLDPQDFLSTLLHTSKKVNGQEDHPENNTGYSNPIFDKLCDEADSELNPLKRMALYQQAEQIAINDAPWKPLFFQKDVELDKPRVHDIRDCALGHLPYTTTYVTA